MTRWEWNEDKCEDRTSETRYSETIVKIPRTSSTEVETYHNHCLFLSRFLEKISASIKKNLSDIASYSVENKNYFLQNISDKKW